MKGLKFCLIPHTLWEREYFLDYRFTIRWLDILVSSVIKVLRGDTQFNWSYIFDGQLEPVLDWLSRLSEPERNKLEPVLKELTESSRLIIGPLYIHPYWTLCPDMALYKLISLGFSKSEDFHSDIKEILTLQSGPVPYGVLRLLEKFGIKVIITDSATQVQKVSKFNDILIIELTPRDRVVQLSKSPYLSVNRLKKFYTETDNIKFILCGHEYDLIPDELGPVLGYLKDNGLDIVSVNDPRLEDIIQQRDITQYVFSPANLKEVGYWTARMDLKLIHWSVDSLIRTAETFLAIVSKYLGYVPAELYRQLTSITEDSLRGFTRKLLTGTVSDTTADSLKIRAKRVFNKTIELLRAIASKIVKELVSCQNSSDTSDTTGTSPSILLFNPSSVELTISLDDTKIVKAPPLSISILNSDGHFEEFPKMKLKIHENNITVSTNSYTANVNPRGELELTLATGKSLKGLCKLSLIPDRGCASTPKPENSNRIEPSFTEVKLKSFSGQIARVEVSHVFSLPSNWSSDNISERACEVNLTYEFKTFSDIIELHLKVRNYHENLRLVMSLSLPQPPSQIILRTPLGYSTVEYPESERELYIVHSGLINLKLDSINLCTLTRGLRNACVKDNELNITLFRGYSELHGKELGEDDYDMVNLITSDSQMIGELNLELGIVVYQRSPSLRELMSLHERYNSIPVAFKLKDELNIRKVLPIRPLELESSGELVGISLEPISGGEGSRDRVSLKAVKLKVDRETVVPEVTELCNLELRGSQEDLYELSGNILSSELWLGSSTIASLKILQSVSGEEYLYTMLDRITAKRYRAEVELLRLLDEMDKLPESSPEYSKLKLRALEVNIDRLELTLSQLLTVEKLMRIQSSEDKNLQDSSQYSEEYRKLLASLDDIGLELCLARAEYQLYRELFRLHGESSS